MDEGEERGGTPDSTQCGQGRNFVRPERERGSESRRTDDYEMRDVERILGNVISRSIDTGKQAKPEIFHGRPGEDVNAWIFKFNIAAKSNGWDEGKMFAKLPAFLSDSALDFYALVILEDEMTYFNCDRVFRALREKFLPSDYEQVVREELENLKQGSESVSAFVLKIQKKCRQVDEDMPEKEMIRIILKGMDPRISRPVFASKPDSVQELEKLARGVEAGYVLYREKNKEKEITETVKNLAEKFDNLMDRMESGKRFEIPYPSRSERYPFPVPERPRFTGGRGFQVREPHVQFERASRYPDTNDTRTLSAEPKCFVCRRPGHIARNCPTEEARMARERRGGNNERVDVGRNPSGRPPQRNPQREFLRSFGRSEALFLAQENTNESMPKLVVTISNESLCFYESFEALVDTGSAATMCSLQAAEMLGYGRIGQALRPVNQPMACANGHPVTVHGMFTATIGFDPELIGEYELAPEMRGVHFTLHSENRVLCEIEVIVADIFFDVVLGLDFIRKSSMVMIHRAECTEFGVLFMRPLTQGGNTYEKTDERSQSQQTNECFTDSRGKLKTDVWLSIGDRHSFSGDLVTVSIDTGAVTSVIDVDFLHTLINSDDAIEAAGKQVLVCTNGSTIQIVGNVTLSLTYTVAETDNESSYQTLRNCKIKATVVAGVRSKILLGQNFLRKERIWLHPLSGKLMSVKGKPVSDGRIATRVEPIHRIKVSAEPTLNAISAVNENLTERDESSPPVDPGNAYHEEIVCGATKESNEAAFLEYYDNLLKGDQKHKSVLTSDEETFIVPYFGEELSVSAKLTDEETHVVCELLRPFRNVFSFPGEKLGECFVYPCVIHTVNEIPVRRMPFSQSLETRRMIRDEIDEGLRLGIYRHSNSPYAASAHLVSKKDGKKRLVVDYRALNKVTVTDSYPLPSSKMMLNCLTGAKWFSLLDCCRGFNQIAVQPDSIPKTAFVTHDGLFECPFMPMGIKNGPATYQRVIDCVLGGLKWNCCIVYMDDILIYSESFDQHVNHVKQVLTRLSESGLTLKPSKCFFFMRGVSFLGYFIDSEGVHMQPEKVEAIVNFPDPTNLTEARSFKGLAGFYSHFIPKFSEIVKPITNLFRKNVPFCWDGKPKAAAEELKQMLLRYPVLVHFDPSHSTALHCDASGHGLGAVIGHIMNDERFHPVEFASRLLSSAESNYSATDKEALAIVWAVKKFNHFLEGIKFDVFTDHKALEWLQTKPQLPRRLLKFALELQNYNYTIHYKPGKCNSDADALSRAPVSQPEDTEGNLLITAALYAEASPLTQLKAEQRMDRFFSEIVQRLESGRHSGPYALIDEVLYRQKSRKTGPKNLLCIPQCLQEDVMYAIHDDLFGCHMGVVKTLDKLRERFFFPNMESYVRNYIKSCRSCLTRKKERLAPYGFLRPIEVGEPFDMIGIDMFGPVTRSKNNKRWIIVASDYLTRYVELAALSSATSSQVAHFLINNVFKTHGFVSKILSDRGTNFLSDMMQDLYDQLSIHKINTTHYRPQTDGLVESFNKTMAEMLSHYTSSDQRDWDVHLPLIQFAYNSSKSSATGFSPFFLVHGREPRIPIDIQYEIPRARSDDRDHLTSVIANLAHARVMAKEAIKKTQQASKRYYDRHRRPLDFQIGDLVMRYVPTPKLGLTNKLLHKFNGPYIITTNHENNVFTLSPLNSRGKDVIVNAESLKHFHDRLLYDLNDDDEDLITASSDTSGELVCKAPAPPSSPDAPDPPAPAPDSSSLSTIVAASGTVPREENTSHPLTLSPTRERDESLSLLQSTLGGDPTKPPLPLCPDPPSPTVHTATSTPHTAASLTSESETEILTPPAASETLTSSSSRSAEEVLPQPEPAPHHMPPPSMMTAEQASTAVSALSTASTAVFPRRSTRPTRRPVRYTKALFFPLTLLCLFSVATSSFTQVAPLVWRVTDRPVISGVTRVFTKIKYESPCVIFDFSQPDARLRFGDNDQADRMLHEIKRWCDEEFSESFLKPLQKFCSDSEVGKSANSLSREKRVVAAAILITTAVVSVITTVGIAAYASYSSTETEIQSLETEQDTLMRQVRENMHFNNQVKEILAKLDQRDDLMRASLNNLTEKVYHLIAFHGPSLTTVAKIAASLTTIKERFFAVSQDWSRKQLNPLLLLSLNITMPCTDECPAHMMTPISCTVDLLRKQIQLAHEQRTTKSKTQILKADPFRLIVNSTADTVCFASYRGPHSVIYDEKLDCVTPIRGDSESNENVILSPAVAYCSDAIPFNESSHYWSRTECMPKPMIRDDDIIQIKSSNSYNFIYCASLQIVVFNRTFDCPSFVFSIPHFASFSIGRLHYRADNLQLAHVLKLAPVTSSRVNFHLLPKLPMFQLHDDIRQEIADLKNFTSLPEHHLIHHDHASLAIVVVLLLPMFIFFAFKVLHVLRRGSNTNARSSFSPRSERVELSKDVRGSLRTKEDNTPSSELEGNSNRSGQSRPSGQSSRFSSKQAALLCVLSLLLTPDVNAANCPHAVTLSIDTSFCSTIAPKGQPDLR